MRRRDGTRRGLKLWQRFVLACFGLAIAATGALALAEGKLYYQNAHFFLMFSPFAVIVGTLMAVFAFRLGPRS
jgi:hypothetical protein